MAGRTTPARSPRKAGGRGKPPSRKSAPSVSEPIQPKHDPILEAAARLHLAGVLDPVADGRFREGVDRGLVYLKLGEPLFSASEQFSRLERTPKLIAWFRTKAEAYTDAANKLGRAEIDTFPELEDAASFYAHIAQRTREATADLRPRETFEKRKANRLVFESLAVLRHTTDLTITGLLGEIMHNIMTVAAEYPYHIPPSDPQTRYNRVIALAKSRGTTPDDLLSSFRAALFSRDDRFPRHLFDAHDTRYTRRTK